MKRESAAVEERWQGQSSSAGGSLLTIAYPQPADFLACVPFDCELDPQLVRMDEVLDDSRLVLAIMNDLARSAAQSLWNRRPSTPVEVSLRLTVARRAKTTNKGHGRVEV